MDSMEQLIEQLKIPEFWAFARIADKLNVRMKAGEDVSAALPALWDRVLHLSGPEEDRNVYGDPASDLLADYYFKEKRWPEILDRIMQMVNTGQRDGDVWHVLGVLYSILLKMGFEKLDNASLAIAVIPLAVGHNGYPSTAKRAQEMIASAMGWSDSVEKIERIEQIERKLEEQLSDQRSRFQAGMQTTKERVPMQADVAILFQRIGERKARLARKRDGELLAGETIPRSGRPAQMYRTVRARM